MFSPNEAAWQRSDGSFVDPFRPEVEPAGFNTEHEMEADREAHLEHVRDMFKSLDLFIFTLGLTEAWRSKETGAVFPLAPGVTAGAFDAEKYEFVNFNTEDNIHDLSKFAKHLKNVNPSAKILLTVSPVPLAATFENRSVLTSTTYSKSVLRVAAEELCSSFHNIHYFPSYEIITGNFSRGSYYEDDLRNVRPEGVSHVMRLFLEHYTQRGSARPTEFSSIEGVICEEEKLNQLVT